MNAPDRAYRDDRLAALYDALNPWDASDDFYLRHVMSAASVLDLGCGTGEILVRARQSGHAGRLIGVDPAEPMIAFARAKRGDVEWTLGKAQHLTIEGCVELAMLSGHAFQVLLTDDDVDRALLNVRSSLVPDGRLIFNTRNPDARAWRRWHRSETERVVATASGDVAVWADAATETLPGLVELVEGFRFPEGSEIVSRSTLRFLDARAIDRALARNGFRSRARYGGWDARPFAAGEPEIVVVAEPAPNDRDSPPLR